MSALQRTTDAIKAKTYSYEAMLAALVAVVPYIPDLINWLLHDPTAPEVPAEYKRYLNWLAFALALWARSVVVRKPPAQDTPPAPPTRNGDIEETP
jgi:hypothetical protein